MFPCCLDTIKTKRFLFMLSTWLQCLFYISCFMNDVIFLAKDKYQMEGNTNISKRFSIHTTHIRNKDILHSKWTKVVYKSNFVKLTTRWFAKLWWFFSYINVISNTVSFMEIYWFNIFCLDFAIFVCEWCWMSQWVWYWCSWVCINTNSILTSIYWCLNCDCESDPNIIFVFYVS